MAFEFDGAAKTITLSTGTTSFSWKDCYSRWKDWAQTHAWADFAFVAVGGDALGGGVYAGDYYFLQDGWTVVPQDADHTLLVSGNGYPATPGAQMFGTRAGRNIQIQLSRSSLTQTIAVGSGVLPTDVTAIATASRDAILSDGTRFAGARIDAAITSRAAPGQGLTALQDTQIDRMATLVGVPGQPEYTNTSSGTLGAGGVLTTLTRVAGVLWRTVVTRNAGTATEQATVTPENVP